ncbi:hypothetical protein UlMin_011859 [Ulmus minor]
MNPNQTQPSPSSSTSTNLTPQELSQLQSKIKTFHTTTNPSSNTCTSLLTQRINAPMDATWRFVRDFGNPHKYKPFIKSCKIIEGDGKNQGSLRDLDVVSGLPASTSRERLEVLDEENRVLSFRVVGGDHRLRDYHSVTSVNEILSKEGENYTEVLESYCVEIPHGNSWDDTKTFVDTVVNLNLQKLEEVTMASMKRPE